MLSEAPRRTTINLNINLSEFRYNAGNATSELIETIATQVTTRTDDFRDNQVQNAVVAIEAIIVNFINSVTI